LPFNQYTWLTTHNSFAKLGDRSATGSIILAPTNQQDTVTSQLNVCCFLSLISVWLLRKSWKKKTKSSHETRILGDIVACRTNVGSSCFKVKLWCKRKKTATLWIAFLLKAVKLWYIGRKSKMSLEHQSIKREARVVLIRRRRFISMVYHLLLFIYLITYSAASQRLWGGAILTPFELHAHCPIYLFIYLWFKHWS